MTVCWNTIHIGFLYKDGCSDDNDVCFDYKDYCFEDKGPCCKNNKGCLQNNLCCIDDNKVNIDWLNVIVELQWSLFGKQGVLFCDNEGKLVNNDPDCYNKVHCFVNYDCCCYYNKLCLHYKEGFFDYKNEIVMG